MQVSVRWSSFVSGVCVAASINLITSGTPARRDLVLALLLLALGVEFAYLAEVVERADRYGLAQLVRAPSLSPSEFRAAYESEVRAVRPQVMIALSLAALTSAVLVLAVLYFS
jgi:hypothetical protein